MPRIVFEAIVFLRINSRYWNKYTVQKAFSLAIKESQEERLNKFFEQAETEQEQQDNDTQNDE